MIYLYIYIYKYIAVFIVLIIVIYYKYICTKSEDRHGGGILYIHIYTYVCMIILYIMTVNLAGAPSHSPDPAAASRNRFSSQSSGLITQLLPSRLTGVGILSPLKKQTKVLICVGNTANPPRPVTVYTYIFMIHCIGKLQVPATPPPPPV